MIAQNQNRNLVWFALICIRVEVAIFATGFEKIFIIFSSKQKTPTTLRRQGSNEILVLSDLCKKVDKYVFYKVVSSGI